MILIADSGSTKADWVIVDDNLNVVDEVNSKGFNPLFHDDNFILTELHDRIRLKKIAEKVKKVYFYGASCSSEERNEIIRDAFTNFFTKADIHVGHDLQAAVYATTPYDPGMVGILGTGSNACFFDGKEIIQNRPSIGFILGDEGSGASFGKELLNRYLYGKMPKHLAAELTEAYELTKDSILEHVYMRPSPNTYLASFARFLSDHRSEPFVKDLIFQGLLQFVAEHMCIYSNYREVKAHFIGSIAYFYEDILREVCERREIQVGHIIQRPIERLVEYHLSKEGKLAK